MMSPNKQRLNRNGRSGVKLPEVIGFVLVASFVLLSCSGDGIGLSSSGDLAGASGFAAKIQPLFDRNCVRCHSPGGIGFNQTGGNEHNGLDLTPGNAYNSLVNQPTFELPEAQPIWRVLPGNPEKSYALRKISPGTPKFGSRMPTDGPPFLSDTEIRTVSDWILSGAPDN